LQHILQLLILENQEDLLTTAFVVTPSDVVGFLEVRIDELPFVLDDGLHEVELQGVLVPVFDLQLGPSHIDVDPGFLSVFFQLVDDLP